MLNVHDYGLYEKEYFVCVQFYGEFIVKFSDS